MQTGTEHRDTQTEVGRKNQEQTGQRQSRHACTRHAYKHRHPTNKGKGWEKIWYLIMCYYGLLMELYFSISRSTSVGKMCPSYFDHTSAWSEPAVKYTCQQPTWAQCPGGKDQLQHFTDTQILTCSHTQILTPTWSHLMSTWLPTGVASDLTPQPIKSESVGLEHCFFSFFFFFFFFFA